MTKKFLIQIDPGDDTRGLCSDALLCEVLTTLARLGVTAQTEGTIPAVTVIQDEKPDPKP